MNGKATTFQGLFVAFGCLALVFTKTTALQGNSWQKRLDRAFLQVDGVTPQGRFRSIQRALKDPQLRTDVTKAIEVVREKGFGKGHPEFIELLWPEGTQARRDLEAINALTKQLPERREEVSKSSSGVIEILRSMQESLRFGDEGAQAVATSLFESLQSDPSRVLKLAENALRNEPIEVESPAYNVLETFAYEKAESGGSFLTVPDLEVRKYEAFRSFSVPLPSSSDAIYTLKTMGSALTELFSCLELGNNARSALIPMTTPFVISETTDDAKMLVQLPQRFQENPPEPGTSSKAVLDEFPETVLATLSFPGVCTTEEIERQKTKLLDRLETIEGWNLPDRSNATDTGDAVESQPEFYVLQYNAPGTLPWRRNNEIAVVVEPVATTETEESDEAVIEAELETEETDSDSTEEADESESDDDSTPEEDTPTTESSDEE